MSTKSKKVLGGFKLFYEEVGLTKPTRRIKRGK